MRTRVIFEKQEYRPQKKTFFGWDYFRDWTKEPQVVKGMRFHPVMSFQTLNEAIDFCRSAQTEGVKWESKV